MTRGWWHLRSSATAAARLTSNHPHPAIKKPSTHCRRLAKMRDVFGSSSYLPVILALSTEHYTKPQGTWASLFSAVSSAFTINVQSKLQPDPNETTAAYTEIPIRTMNDTLFPDRHGSNHRHFGWLAPPDVVTAQSLLHAGLTTSLSTPLLATPGKQRTN